VTPQQLKNSILQMAMQGKLVEQHPEEGTGEELYQRIQKEKNKLVKEGKIKKEQELPPITIDEIPFEIPESWKWVRLGDICELFTGNSISETVKKNKYMKLIDGYPYIATKDIDFNHNINYSNGVIIPYKENFRHAEKDTVLMCIEGGSAGRKIGILKRDVCFGNKLCVFKGYLLLNKFIYYFMQSPFFHNLFQANISGIIGGVSIKKIKNSLFSLPSISEQKRIITKIEELLPCLERYEKAYDRLEAYNTKFPVELKKSIIQEAIQGKLVPQDANDEPASVLLEKIEKEKNILVKEGKVKKQKPMAPIAEDEIPFEIPDSWKWVRWGEISQSIQYGYNAPAKPSGRIKMVRISDIQDGSVMWENVPYCDINEKDIDTYLLQENDILFARTGGTVGKSYLVKKLPVDAIYAGYLIRTRYSSQLCPEYLKMFMESDLYWSQLHNGTIATAQPNCNGKTLSKMIVPIPPVTEQKRIVAKLKEILAKIDKVKRQ
jgi:type I restriction enzyme S subunit